MIAGAEYIGDDLTQALLSKFLCRIAEYLIACNEARTVQQISVTW